MNIRVLILFGFFALHLSSCSDDEKEIEFLQSEYEIGGQVHSISSDILVVKGVKGEPDQLRLEQLIPGQEGPDVIVLLPVQGPGQLEGKYLFSKTGDIGTYNLVYLKNRKEDAFDWMTNGDGGADLKLVYEGQKDGEDLYTLVIEQFDLNYGNWDYIAGKWISKGNLSFRFQYQGSLKQEP